MSDGKMITVNPEDLTFQIELDKQSYCDVKVVNNTNNHVAFKVKTTTPKKYFVRPNIGVIQPEESCVITVTLQAQGEYPSDLPCKDKFLLQSTKVPPISDVDEIPPETFSKDSEDKVTEEYKLRVVYITPPLSNHANSENNSLVDLKSSKRSFDTNTILSSSMYDEVHALRLAKEERDAAIHQTKRLTQELEILKMRRKRGPETGFTYQFAAFVGVIGILMGLIFNLTFSSPTN